MDVAVHPDYATNGWIYLSYSRPRPRRHGDDPGHAGADQGRMRSSTRRRSSPRRSSSIGPGPTTSARASCSTARAISSSRSASAGSKPDAQDLARPNGKVHRIRDDGRVPEDNPFVEDSRARCRRSGATATATRRASRCIPCTGELYDAEHGPRGGDELNLVQPGPQLRLAGDHLRHELRRHADHRPDGQGGHGAAGAATGCRRSRSARSPSTRATVPAVEEQPARVLARGAGTAPAAARRRQGHEAGGAVQGHRPHPRRRESGPTASSTWPSTAPTASRGWCR